MRRREFLLRSVGLTGLATLMAGCGTGPTGRPQLPALPVDVTLPKDLTTLISNVNAITSKVSSSFSALPPSMQSTAKSWLAKLQSAAGSINVGKTIADVQGYVADFQTAWTAIKPILAPASSTPVAGSSGAVSTIGNVVSAVETVLPVVLKIAGLAAMFARPARTGMTYTQAMAVLRS